MKEVKFSLVFRDMWQSAGKYQPRVDQLLKVAPAIIRMGCFDRVETNGGGFEQVNLLYGENPNRSVREWTKPFHEVGIQTHMLDRALNGLRMSPCPKDLRKLFYKVKKAQGTDITRIFCGLNDTRNIIPSIQYAKEAGMIAQASMCITHSPIHTVEYYVNLAKVLIDAGADILVCHHSHTLQRIEIYKGKYIFYSIGNFIFDQQAPVNSRACMVTVSVSSGLRRRDFPKPARHILRLS